MTPRSRLGPAGFGLVAGLLAVIALGCFDRPEPEGGKTRIRSTTRRGGLNAEPKEEGAAPSPATPATKKSDLAIQTVDPRLDTKQLVDVVKEEVKGGESERGPTPVAYLWLPSDVSLIRDEPMTVDAPLGLGPIKIPPSNLMTKGKVELGKLLYFDPRISRDATVSCATCHNPEKGWTDGLPTSIGIGGRAGSRNAPTVLNTTYGRTMFWDGRSPSLEGQSLGPVQNKIEMGDQSYQQIVERLRTIPDYKARFKIVFGTDVTLDGIAKAVASFERTALTGNSKYDQYDRGTSTESLSILSDSEKRGMVLFGLRLRQDDDFKPGVALKKANCTSCHGGQNFSDEEFHNLGVGWDAARNQFADLGRFVIAPVGAKTEIEIGAFKTPTCRDLVKTSPYMHDGSEKTLESVVALYNRGGNKNPTLDKDMKPLKLTAQEESDVVAFLRALTGESPTVSIPTLPPGPDGKAPDARAALTPPQAPAKTAMVDGPHPLTGQ